MKSTYNQALKSEIVLTVFCCRDLHWVTIEMLCVPVDEEIPEVSDSVVKAITGECHTGLVICLFIAHLTGIYYLYV